jgi:hypothetical protein
VDLVVDDHPGGGWRDGGVVEVDVDLAQPGELAAAHPGRGHQAAPARWSYGGPTRPGGAGRTPGRRASRRRLGGAGGQPRCVPLTVVPVRCPALHMEES